MHSNVGSDVEVSVSASTALALTDAGIVVYVHGGVPSDAGFSRFLAFCRAHRPVIRGYLAFPEGGLPTVRQRASAAQDFEAFAPRRSAIVTRLAEGQHVAKALDWMRGSAWFAAFPPDRLEEVRSYLQLSSAEFRQAMAAARYLAKRIDVTLSCDAPNDGTQ